MPIFSNFLKNNYFLIGIFLALGCGFLFPGNIPIKNFNLLIVVIILFNIGFTLPSEAIKSGLQNMKLHIATQLFIFVITPLFIFLTSIPFQNLFPKEIIIGIYALACLPTTVSSCIAFTQISGGNVVAAVFNSSLANCSGIILSPLLLSLLLNNSGSAFFSPDEIISILLSLVLKMILPLFCGQLVRIFLHSFADKQKQKIGVINNLLILTIIFLAVVKTTNEQSINLNISVFIIPFVYLSGTHIVLVAIIGLLAKKMKFSLPDTVTYFFVSSQKSLATGAPMLSTFFASRPEILGLALLPLIYYHFFQLVFAGLVKNYLTKGK